MLVVVLLVGLVLSKDSDYCLKLVPVIPSRFDVCNKPQADWNNETDTEEGLTDIEVVAKCTKFWADDFTEETNGYYWSKAKKYEDDCKSHQICCEFRKETNTQQTPYTEHSVIFCPITKVCNWIIPNWWWLLIVILAVVGLCVLSCIISCCCGCCSGSGKGSSKKPRDDDGSSAAALAAQQQQLVALQAATSMALMTQQQQLAAAAAPAAAPAPAPAAAAAAPADPDPFGAKPEYGSSEPALDPEPSAFDAPPEEAAPGPEPDYGGF